MIRYIFVFVVDRGFIICIFLGCGVVGCIRCSGRVHCACIGNDVSVLCIGDWFAVRIGFFNWIIICICLFGWVRYVRIVVHVVFGRIVVGGVGVVD